MEVPKQEIVAKCLKSTSLKSICPKTLLNAQLLSWFVIIACLCLLLFLKCIVWDQEVTLNAPLWPVRESISLFCLLTHPAWRCQWLNFAADHHSCSGWSTISGAARFIISPSMLKHVCSSCFTGHAMSNEGGKKKREATASLELDADNSTGFYAWFNSANETRTCFCSFQQCAWLCLLNYVYCSCCSQSCSNKLQNNWLFSRGAIKVLQ